MDVSVIEILCEAELGSYCHIEGNLSILLSDLGLAGFHSDEIRHHKRLGSTLVDLPSERKKSIFRLTENEFEGSTVKEKRYSQHCLSN